MPQVFFTQDKKAKEEAATMASCFQLRTVLFGWFILFVFLSHHLSNVSIPPAVSWEKREQESLNMFKYGSRQLSSQAGSPVLSHQGTSKLLKCFLRNGQTCHAAGLDFTEHTVALLQPLQCTVHMWYLLGRVLKHTSLLQAQ